MCAPSRSYRRVFGGQSVMALRLFRRLVPPAAELAVLKARFHGSAPCSLQYGWWSYVLGERTTPRLQHLSKIFSVDGNLASGKGELAKRLADKLGMLYMPEADTSYLDRMTGEGRPLPQAFNGSCSLERFYQEPTAADGNSYRLQLWMFLMRLLQYSDAVEHLITTGQGVILERSPFSDLVFLESMFKQGYIRKECVQHYNEIRSLSLCEFLPPHLVIYLDVPAAEVLQRLKQSGTPFLQNVPLSYLKNIEESYKKTVLPQTRETSELLTYEGTPDVEKVAEDIEYLTFDKGPWLEQDDVSFHHMRMLVEDKQAVASLASIPKFLPEITVGAHEYDAAFYAFKSLPGKKYAPGYNVDGGDKLVWLK